MRYLLDTHALIWFLGGDPQLSAHARQLIEDEENELFISVASLWEIAIKVSLGKLSLGAPFETLFPAQLESNSIAVLSITIDHLHTVRVLPFHHRDPFDRLIIAQAQAEAMPVISTDAVFDSYSIPREWLG